jgi:outer membrane protein OmpA-like peptidoglycan-associated protein
MRRHTVSRLILSSCLGGALLAGLSSGAALAQSNPTASQIISALKPVGAVSDTTRGIRPLSPGGAMAAPAPSMAVPVSTRAASQGVASTSLNIEFRSGSAALTPQAMAELDQLGKALTSADLASYNFKIVGHTDTVGAPDQNQTLSEARAQAVKAYLESKFNVPGAKLQTEGMGETDLAVATPPNTPDIRNRRVQIINLGA